MNNLFCFGYGYVARSLSRCLDGWQVSGTRRKEDYITEYGKVFSFDPSFGTCYSRLVTYIENSTHLLISIPPDNSGDLIINRCRGLLTSAKNISWIGYLSTTGVYGNHNGCWVDEETIPIPSSPRAIGRCLAEQQWIAVGRDLNIPVNIFRLAGIYGPKRNPLLRLRKGLSRCVSKKGQVFGRIHVDDIVMALQASINNPRHNEIYNICDDFPASPQEVISYAANLLGIDMPPLEDYDECQLSKMSQEFFNDCKRVSNQKIKSKLKVQLKFPTYREGLLSLYKQM